MARRVRPDPVIPDMEVLRQIGGGSYGEIWMARSVTGTLRAVKVVYRGDFEDDRSFEREFEGILKYEPVARTHPGLVDVLHVGRGETEEEEFYYYVMELGDDVERGSEIIPADYEARNLRGDMLRAGKRPMGVDFCLEVGERLAGALAHLHDCGLAHRDVKPSNVIFIKGRACLADIGLVAVHGQRTFVGTEGFVPPEGPGSPGADVFALGKIIYEMATGKDRLEFPELPDEPVPAEERKRWLALNKIVCDVCEPRSGKRKINESRDLERVLGILRRSGKLRKRRAPAGLAFVTLVVLGAMIAPVFTNVTSNRIGGSSEEEAEEDTEILVTITSSPDGAEVFSSDGDYLGVTPYDDEIEFGSKLAYEVRYSGYEPYSINERADRNPMVLVAELNRYPPEEGVPWEDFLGQSYSPEGEKHRTTYVVSSDVMLQSPFFEEEGWQEFEVVENGVSRMAALVTEDLGERFVDWLVKESASDGLSKDWFRVRPVFVDAQSLADLPPDLVDSGLKAFRIEIEPIRPVLLTIDSEPSGAFVYMNDSYLGITPLEQLEVQPGRVQLRFEQDGYENEFRNVVLREGERMRFPRVKMTATRGRPWQVDNWKNSLGMEFAKLGEDLLVARWETRVRDYAEYAEATERRVMGTDFPQDGSHPVVNITRAEAEEFCEWLTKREREDRRIGERHRYRLPKDVEWTRMLGEVPAPGETPAERSRAGRTNFPWGDRFPPEDKLVNLAGMEASGEFPVSRLITNYEDGFPHTSPVGSFPPNRLGIHDLGGNVREWVQDDFSVGLIKFGVEYVFETTRGGSWKDFSEEVLTNGKRRPVTPGTTGSDFGFRVVLVKEERVEENGGELGSNDG